MTNNTRKIVVLGNIDSPKIEQAIFILRDCASTYDESAAVLEAQKIVDTYLNNLYSPVIKKNKKTFRRFLLSLLYVGTAMIFGTYLSLLIK